MDATLEKRTLDALRGYVGGDLAEPAVISAVRGIPAGERVEILNRHRLELAAIDGGRSVILRSMLLPLAQRDG